MTCFTRTLRTAVPLALFFATMTYAADQAVT